MDKLRTLGSYQVLRLLSASTSHYVYKVKYNARVYRLTATAIFCSTQTGHRQIQRIAQLLQKCLKYKQLSHPNVEIIYDIFHFQEGPDNFLALVGEYSTQGDLEDLIQEETTRKSAQLRQVMIDLCSGLDYLHSRSIIHCNITPENVRRIGGTYKITFPSFREVRWFNSRSRHASTEQSRALPDQYISPEQHTQVCYSSATDVWSMGVIFYELLSGQQFKLFSEQLPCEMGSFTEVMLADVSNSMMRSLLKEMLTVDSTSRISIKRAQNILSNTDISRDDPEIEEDIIENSSYRTLTLPLFTYLKGEQTATQLPTGNEQSEFIEASLDNYLITIIYKASNNSLQFCAYYDEKDFSFMVEYGFQCLPTAFSLVFTSAKEVFQELRLESMSITSINSFGELVLSIHEERYLFLKQARQKLPIKDNLNIYKQSSTESSKKDPLQHLKLGEKGSYSQEMEEFESEQQTLSSNLILRSISKLYMADRQLQQDEFESMQKELQLLMEGGTDSLSKILSKSQAISLCHMRQQDYVRSIQHNQKVLQYLIKIKSGCNIVYPLSKLIACSELLSDEQQVAKWQGVLRKEYSMFALPCTLLAAAVLDTECTLYDQNGRIEESTAVFRKMKAYLLEVNRSVRSRRGFEDSIIDHVLQALISLFKNMCVSLYQFGFILLTMLYDQVKLSPTPKHKEICIRIQKEISKLALTSTLKAPLLNKTLHKWVEANMPEKYSEIFNRSFY